MESLGGSAVLKELGKPLRFGSALNNTPCWSSDRYCTYSLEENLGLVIAFEIDRPFIRIRKRCFDFTMNALLKVILSGEIADPYGGTEVSKAE